MAVVSELIRVESDGTISFGDYSLEQKSKISDFEYQGNIYKVKTYRDITKLECNEIFVYESVPGTTVEHLSVNEEGLSFSVEGDEDAQITLELEPETEYEITVGGVDAGCIQTNLGGKLSLSVELDKNSKTSVNVRRA